MDKGVLILGATSAIAREVAKVLASKGYSLYLASRDVEELGRMASDLHIRFGVDVDFGFFDIEDISEARLFLQRVLARISQKISSEDGLPKMDKSRSHSSRVGEKSELKTYVLQGVVLAAGMLGDASLARQEFSEAEKIIKRNFTGACAILGEIANHFEKQKGGFIIGISSVAGDRGRQSNYIYGAAKGGLSIFLQGLRNRLYPSGVHVMTVKPGFVDTSMTYGKEGMFLVASPEKVGKAIVAALEKKKDVVYIPWFWRLIMMLIKAIPEKIFKKMRL